MVISQHVHTVQLAKCVGTQLARLCRLVYLLSVCVMRINAVGAVFAHPVVLEGLEMVINPLVYIVPRDKFVATQLVQTRDHVYQL